MFVIFKDCEEEYDVFFCVFFLGMIVFGVIEDEDECVFVYELIGIEEIG